MKIVIRSLLLVITSIVFTACGAQPTPVLPQLLPTTQGQGAQGNNPYVPQPGDANMQRGDVTIDSASITRMEGTPPQILLNFSYFPPTPCYQLRVEVTPPDAQNRVNVTAYAVAEKDKPCNLMALTTPLPASLELGSLPTGHYSLWLNGAMVGEFDM